MESGMGGDEKRVRVKFSSKIDEFNVSVPSIAVPCKLGRFGLSEVVNHLLDKAEDPTPFNFIHVESNKIVRGSLEDFMQRESLIVEDVLNLEFVPAVRQPEQGGSLPVEDWISSISLRECDTQNVRGIAGGFDGSFEIFTVNDDNTITSLVTKQGAHHDSVKAVCALKNYSASELEAYVTGSNDGLLKIWGLDTKENTVSEIGRCIGHAGSISSVQVSPDPSAPLVATGAWDNLVCLWDLKSDESASEAPLKKSRNVDQAHTKEYQPLGVFEGHTDNVSAVCWGTGPESMKTLFSGSWDLTIRSWDVERQTSTAVYNGNKVVTCLDHSWGGQLLASGHPDHVARIWDARAGGDAVVKFKLDSHKGWITEVKWNPVQAELLATCSHDNTIKLWDVRSNIPLYTLTEHTAKLFALDWLKSGQTLVSGGADANLLAHSLPAN